MIQYLQSFILGGWIYLAIAMCPIARSSGAEEVIALSNQWIKVEIVPRLGGRISSFGLCGGENILYSLFDKQQKATIPTLAYNRKFKNYYGHVMWVSPQAEWWQQQNTEPKAKAAGARWPPDPYWEFSTFSVISQTRDRVVLTSEHSPFSNVTMTKEIQVVQSGLEMKTTIQNTSRQKVKWGIWSNTRVRPDAVIYVPADWKQALKYEFKTWNIPNEKMLLPEITDKYFIFRPPNRSERDDKIYRGKTFLSPAKPMIIAQIGELTFIKETVAVRRSQVASEHFPVEIYAQITPTISDSFFELEFHGVCKEITPGERLQFVESWSLLYKPDLCFDKQEDTMYGDKVSAQ